MNTSDSYHVSSNFLIYFLYEGRESYHETYLEVFAEINRLLRKQKNGKKVVMNAAGYKTATGLDFFLCRSLKI